jgi:hypothetical protein
MPFVKEGSKAKKKKTNFSGKGKRRSKPEQDPVEEPVAEAPAEVEAAPAAVAAAAETPNEDEEAKMAALDAAQVQEMQAAATVACAASPPWRQADGGNSDLIPVEGQERIHVSTLIGGSTKGFQDGAIEGALVGQGVGTVLELEDGSLLVMDSCNHKVRHIVTDDQTGAARISTVAKSAGLAWPRAAIALPDGRALIADTEGLYTLNITRSDKQHRTGCTYLKDMAVMTNIDEEEPNRRDGPVEAAQSQQTYSIVMLPDERYLLVEHASNTIRMLSADLQHLSTIVGAPYQVGCEDGSASDARFRNPSGMCVLRDGSVLISDQNNHCIRMLSADLLSVSTVAGTPCSSGHRDGPASSALFLMPAGLLLLRDGRVLICDFNSTIRILSADLQTVKTVAGKPFWDGYNCSVPLACEDGSADNAVLRYPHSMTLLSDGRVAVSCDGSIRLLEGAPLNLVQSKPAPKLGKEALAAALLAGAPATLGKRSRGDFEAVLSAHSGAGPAAAAEAGGGSSSDGDGECESDRRSDHDNPTAAEATPLV